MRYLLQTSLALFLMLAGAAGATPPRVTSSDDRVVAGTQTHLYVLRDIQDSLGSHYHGLHDQHLIEIEIDTGAATRHWPLRRIVVNHLNDAGDFRVPGEVQEREGETHAMLPLLRDLGAEPLTPNHWAVQEFSLADGVLMQGETQVLTSFGIRKAGRAQLAILRDAYPAETNADGFPSDEQVDFYDLYGEGDWLCEIRPEGLTLFRADHRVLVAKLHCEDAELAGLWSFHVLIKGDL